jgi:hypothetical protein
MKGLDYAWTHPPAAALKAAGFTFAARYLSHDPSKNLSFAEAGLLRREGLDVVVVWESGAQDARRGRDGGIQDAVNAREQANSCGLTAVPVYFAVDYDAPPGDQDAINAYLDGAASVIGRDRVGVYGGYWPLSRARAAGKATYFWGTVAWSGRNWDPAVNPHTFVPDIMQGAQVKIAGVLVDTDESHGREHTSREHVTREGDFGQWPRPPAAVRPQFPPAGQAWHAKGRISLRQAAHAAGHRVDDVLWETARQSPRGWGPAQHHYVTAGNWDAPLPDGMVVFFPGKAGR